MKSTIVVIKTVCTLNWTRSLLGKLLVLLCASTLSQLSRADSFFPDSNATGFFVSGKGHLVTAYHAVENRKISGTPSFLINDQPGPRSPRWEDVDAALRAALNAR